MKITIKGIKNNSLYTDTISTSPMYKKIISNKVLNISNFLKILDYSNEKIVIKVKKTKNIAIIGENLQICQINKKELIIKGHICSIELGDIDEKTK
mgnify:CR=1 FL=1